MSATERLTRLSFASLDQLAGGDVAKAVDEAINRVLADLARSPDARVRKVVIEVAIKRVPGEKKRFVATATAKTVLPSHKTAATHGVVEVSAGTAEGLFSPASPGNPDQLTIPMEPPPHRRGSRGGGADPVAKA